MKLRRRWLIGGLAAATVAAQAVPGMAQSERRPGGIENVPSQPRESLESVAPGGTRGARRPTAPITPPAASPPQPPASMQPPPAPPKAPAAPGKSSDAGAKSKTEAVGTDTKAPLPKPPTTGGTPPAATAPAAASTMPTRGLGLGGGSERRPGGIEAVPSKQP